MSRRLPDRLTHYLLFVPVAAGLCFIDLGTASLWDVDEGHNAEAAREMFESGDWLVPTFNFRLRTDKPALLYWLQATAYRLFGINEFAARLPSALAALSAVAFTYELGRSLFAPATGLIAASILASTVLFCAAAHFANPDALLLALSTLALLIFWVSFAKGGRGWFIPAGVAAALAVLAKGPVGLALPLAVTGLFLLWSGGLHLLLDRRLIYGAGAFLLVALPWYVWVTAETKFVFPREFFYIHNTGRFHRTMEGHGGPWFYYLACLLVGFAPWSVFFGPAVGYGVGKRAQADVPGMPRPNSPGWKYLFVLPAPYRFLWCWVAVYLVFFSVSATKLPNYVLPLTPPLAVLTARFLDRWRRELLTVPAWWWHTILAGLALTGVAMAVGLCVAGGWLEAPFIHGRQLPGLETWAAVGAVPVVGAAGAWWFLRRRARSGVIICLAATATLFVGLLAVGGSTAVDSYKSARPLVHIFRTHITEPEVRVASYRYYQPSLVFYCRREVLRLNAEPEALEFLAYPLPVYLFVPAPAWQTLEARLPSPHRVLGRHADLYQGGEVLLVTNR